MFNVCQCRKTFVVAVFHYIEKEKLGFKNKLLMLVLLHKETFYRQTLLQIGRKRKTTEMSKPSTCQIIM